MLFSIMEMFISFFSGKVMLFYGITLIMKEKSNASALSLGRDALVARPRCARRWDVIRSSLVHDALTINIAVAADIMDERCLARICKKSTDPVMGRCLIFSCL